ncbi:dipicolinate synthase subunit A [Virgibacillus halotolerans]|uniref:dipicolinic acid synthetase subunit A n=1 Tax=Virgibacillus halotolerans TaxID=1071053 RepID=UPI0019609AE2|nr:dipicolinic acid synthetase subunit A [Virgibacillus halotolerans]MBM7598858.1 dipicolinate synthase subunit A [Virgibacillus halotolerans]
MSDNLNILIMGGDARYLEVIRKLSNEVAKLYLIGYDQLTFDEKHVKQTTMETVDFGIIDAIILPVAGTNEDGKIETMYSDEVISLTEDVVRQTPNHCTIYTGNANAYLKNITHDKQLVALFYRDDLAVYNSIPTAEGALKLIMEQTDVTVHGSNVMILGFGRVGKTVVNLFSSVGANVRVAVRKSADIARVTEMGLTPVKLEKLEQEIVGMDTVINTIPHPVIDADIIAAMETSTLIVDIASAPGGTDFAFAKTHGIKAMHALGLPGKTAPKSAGRIIGNVLLELLRKQKK